MTKVLLPRTLVVIGAALGSGRWLAQHVLSAGAWERVYLVDSDSAKTSVSDLTWAFDAPIHFGRSVESGSLLTFEEEVAGSPTGEPTPLMIDGEQVVVCLAVPPSALSRLARSLHRLVPSPAEILLSVAGLARSIEIVRGAGFPPARITGIHALNDSAAPTGFGQIIYVAPGAGDVKPWLRDLLEEVGAVLRLGTPRQHDAAMSVVQALTHRVLLGFADAVSSSGLDVEQDLWLSRTPLFEALLSLSARALDTKQQAMISVIQASLSDPTQVQRYEDGLQRIPVAEPTPQATSQWIGDVRDRLSGGFLVDLQSAAAAAVSETQHLRVLLAERRASGLVTGIQRRGAPTRVYVGRVVEVTASAVTVEELLVGKPGSAGLAFGDGTENVRRLGIPAKPSRTRLSLAHVRVLSEIELDTYLEQTLAHLTRDLRFLVPESVAGKGVLVAVSEMSLVSSAELVDEVVRTGQRSVVIRVHIRSDRSLTKVTEIVQTHVASVYQWPEGVSQHISADSTKVVYLGPAGTFSEEAALQLARLVGSPDITVTDLASFPDVIDATRAGAVGVLPISSSASGLVTRAVRALLDAKGPVAAGGVIDVAVRFDAYTAPAESATDLRGAHVYSHPQALAQCQAFIRRQGLVPVETPSTAAALELVARSPVPAVAIGGAGKAEEYNLQVVEREIDDLSGSITRFLIVGRPRAFSSVQDGSAPTLRHVWIGDDKLALAELLEDSGAGFVEVLRDSDGHFVLVTSRGTGLQSSQRGVRYLGQIPWSPRTPIVRPGS